MRLFIHKLDCIIDPYSNNLVSQEPVLFAKALVSFPESPFSQVILIANQRKHLASINGHDIIAATVEDILSLQFNICSNDVWILWGGWIDLLNMLPRPQAEAVVKLHAMWRMSTAARMTVCTDMRFPFKRVNFVHAGRVELHGVYDEPILELSQCMNLSNEHSVFNNVKWLPLFMLPTYSNVAIEPRHIGAKTVDLIYATRDWHMLSDSRINKVIRYYVDSGCRSSFLGEHKHTGNLTNRLSDAQTQLLQSNCSFDFSVPFYSVPYAMSYAAAHIAIGDQQYEQYGLIPNRVGEAIVARIATFVDCAVDKNKRLFADDAYLSKVSYVHSAEQVQQRIAAFKQHPDIYAAFCERQATYLKTRYDIAKHFFAVTYDFINKHKHQHNCDICPCKL